MAETCVITCNGRCKVGAWWQTTAQNGLNRLYYINGGVGGYIKGGERVGFQKGKLYFIPYYSSVTTYTDLDAELDHTYVGIIMSPPVLSTDVFCLDSDASEHIKHAVDCFKGLCEAGELAESELELLKAVSLYLIETSVRTNPSSVITDSTVCYALAMMHSGDFGGLTVNDMAKKCHMSVNGFIKKFTKCVGETPYAYYKSLRLRYALVSRAQGATLSEAAEIGGYSDGSALLHAFKSSGGYNGGRKSGDEG